MEFEQKKGFFGKLAQRIGDAILMRPKIDDEFLEELEEILITSDIGMETSMRIVEALREAVRTERIDDRDIVEQKLKEIITTLVDKGERLKMSGEYPICILMVGVNGGGKTTTIAKIAQRYKREGKSILVAAADTFRAAAIEQLEIWAERVDVPVVKHREGADPSAVIYDGVMAAAARGADVLICDTAGRLQNKRNLMSELEKMNKVVARDYAENSREVLLILDATTGKNAVSQAEEFGKAVGITGVVLTKLDGTAKGGIAITIADEFDLPIKFIGTGEKPEDLEAFDPVRFADSIFTGVY